MRIAPYSEYARATCNLVGWDPDNLSADEFARLRDAISRAVEWAWLEYWWPSTTRCERLPLRLEYDAATAYAAGEECWFRPSDAHYVALKATTGNAPASWSGSEYETDTANWMRLADIPGSSGISSYDPGTSYVAGDVVSYGGSLYGCHTAGSGNAPTNASYWGELPDAWRYLPRAQRGRPVIGALRAVAAYDPRKNGRGMNAETVEMDDVFLINPLPAESPWVYYQIAPPRLVGDVWDGGEEYSPEDLEEAIYGTDAQEPNEPVPGSYDHFWDRTDLTFDATLPTLDYNEKA